MGRALKGSDVQAEAQGLSRILSGKGGGVGKAGGGLLQAEREQVPSLETREHYDSGK